MAELFLGIGELVGLSGATAQAVGGTIFMMGTQVGLSYLNRAMTPHPDIPSQQPMSPNLKVSGKSSVASRVIVYGRKLVPGVLTYTGTEQQNGINSRHEVWTLTGMDRPVTAIEGLYDGTTEVVFDTDPVTAYQMAQNRFRGALFLEKHLGDPADTAQPFPRLAAIVHDGWQPNTHFHLNQWIIDPNGNGQFVVKEGKSGSTAPTWSTTFNQLTFDGESVPADPWNDGGSGVQWQCVEGTPNADWGATDRQYGCAKVHLWFAESAYQYAVVSGVTYSKQVISALAQSQPNWKFLVKGLAVYDPRTSATAYSTNPALILRDYLTDDYFGLGYAATEIDDTSFAAAANVCDELVNLRYGGTENRYTCSLLFDTSRKPTDVIKDILSTMCGELVYVGGKWMCYAGAWRGSQGTLTEDHIHGSIRTIALASKRDLHNGAKGTFLIEATSAPVDFPAYINNTYGTADGEPLWLDLQLAGTNSCSMAQRIAKIAVEESRRQLIVQLTCDLSAYVYAPGDTVAVTHSRCNWSAKTFRVMESRFVMDSDGKVPALRVRLTLKEHDAAIYNWDPATEEQALSTTTPYLMPTMDAAAILAGRASNINQDGTYATANYHASAARRQVANNRGGSTSGTNTVVGSFVLHVPPGFSSYKGTLSIQLNATPGNTAGRAYDWSCSAFLRAGTITSAAISVTGSAGVGDVTTSGAVQLTGLPSDSDVTIEVVLTHDCQDINLLDVGTTTATFYQYEYADQDLSNLE